VAGAGFRLTERDCRIVQAVAEHDFLSSTQIGHLFWGYDPEHPDISSRCRFRLRHLAEHGFLRRIQQPVALTEGRKPWIYALDGRGADLVCEIKGLDRTQLGWKPSDSDRTPTFLSHQLAIGDVYVSVALAAHALSIPLAEWIDDRQLRRQADRIKIDLPGGGTKHVAIVPDGFFSLRVGKRRLNHFLEVDRATVTLTSSRTQARTWAMKVRAYMAYYRSGAYFKRFGETRSLRILTVTDSRERAERMRRVTEREGGKGRFWFTSKDDVTPDQVMRGAIWRKAGNEEPVRLLPLDVVAGLGGDMTRANP
jgi:hypothetical protein